MLLHNQYFKIKMSCHFNSDSICTLSGQLHNFLKVTAIPLRRDTEVILRNSVTRLPIYKIIIKKEIPSSYIRGLYLTYLFYCILYGLECFTVYWNNIARNAKRFLRLSK